MKNKIDEKIVKEFMETIDNINTLDDETKLSLGFIFNKLVDECLKNNQTILEIAPYKINVDKDALEVTYKDYIKYPSKTDNQTIVDNTFYYLIRPTKEKNILYSSFNPVIRIKNIISIQDNIPRELLNIELLNGEGYNLKDYIEDSLDDNVVGNKTTVSFTINEENERLNFEKYFVMNDLLPVKYDKESDSYIHSNNEVLKDPYKKVLADIEKNKLIVKALYECLTKYYNK